MTEIRDLSFLIDSPEYRQNAAFVTACYREMLDRDIEAEELFRWCRQLDGVYSRKSLISAIEGSVKFTNRFEIKNIELYRKQAFFPRAVQHVINKLNTAFDVYDKGCFGFLPHVHVRFEFPKYEKIAHNWSEELDMLSLCQLETLRNTIGILQEKYGNICTYGVIADDLVDKQESKSDAFYNTALVTDIDRIIDLIENRKNELQEINYLLVPVPVPTENITEVVVDKN